jgi:hypothetical protein
MALGVFQEVKAVRRDSSRLGVEPGLSRTRFELLAARAGDVVEVTLRVGKPFVTVWAVTGCHESSLGRRADPIA